MNRAKKYAESCDNESCVQENSRPEPTMGWSRSYSFIEIKLNTI